MIDLSRWFVSLDAPLERAPLEYSPPLVLISVLVAVAGGVAAMQLIRLAHRADLFGTAAARAAHWTAVLVLGGSVWSMHFVGMLAVDICQPVRYEPWLTALSMLPALLAAAVGLQLVQGARSDWRTIAVAGTDVGAGIGLMHYTGMAAMRMDSVLRYDPLWFALSIVVAVGLAVAALALLKRLEHSGWPRAWVIVVSGTVMGLAISGMHYTAMQGSQFIGPVNLLYQRWSGQQMELALTVAGVALVLLGFAWGTIGLLVYRNLVQRLRARDRTLRDILDHLPGAVLRLAVYPDNRIERVLVGRGLEALTGRSLEDYLQQRWTLLDPLLPEEREGTLALMKRALESGAPVESQVRLLHADGQLRIVDVRAVAHRGPAGVHFIDLFLSDVTALHRMRQQERELLDAIDRLLGRALLSLDGELLDVNERLAGWLGYAPEELIGQPHRRLWLSDQDEADMQAFWTALRSGAPQAGEFARRGKQGQTLYLRGWYQPLVGEDGRPRAVLKLVIDVSEQVRLVQELRQLSESLQAALAARSAFFANISHEIRTPMNAVVGFAELLRDSLADPRQRQQAQSILDAARALLRILNDLLDVAKLESGEFAILEAPFRLDRLLRDLVSQFGVLASRKAVDLRLDLPAELPPCWRGDGDRVRQILSNLLGNAVKFTERGHITLGARAQEGGVCLWVADTGIGIVPERQQAIFDPFVQADAGTARRYGGTGLGMSIVKRLAERMGGRVTLESALGKGTTVTLWLPLPVDPTGCPDVADDEAPSAADARPLRLLACDDVAQNREVLQLLLQRAGHAIEVFADGQSLLQRYQHDPQAWDAALLDLHMPGWDGLQTCRALRAWEAEQGLPRLPVLALTASVMESDRVAAAAAGMDGFLEKPVTLRALSEALADLRAQRPATAPLPAAAGARPDGEVLAPSRGQALWGDEWIPRLRQWVDEQGGARALGGADSWSEADWHRLAGVAANLAAPAFAQAARACEQALRSKQTPPVGAAQQAWQALCAAVQALPKPARSPDAAAPAASASAPVAAATVEDAVPLWQALLAASERGEVDEPALQRLAQLDPAGAQQLQQWLDEFDFAAAQRWLRERLDHAVKGAPDER